MGSSRIPRLKVFGFDAPSKNPPFRAVFGWVARREAGQDSDIDLLVEAPEGASSFEFVQFKQLLERVLGRQIDLVEYGGLKPKLDDDIRRDAVLL